MFFVTKTKNLCQIFNQNSFNYIVVWCELNEINAFSLFTIAAETLLSYQHSVHFSPRVPIESMWNGKKYDVHNHNLVVWKPQMTVHVSFVKCQSSLTARFPKHKSSAVRNVYTKASIFRKWTSLPLLLPLPLCGSCGDMQHAPIKKIAHTPVKQMTSNMLQ